MSVLWTQPAKNARQLVSSLFSTTTRAHSPLDFVQPLPRCLPHLVLALPIPPHILPMPTTFVPSGFELLTSVSRNSNNCLLYLSLNVLYGEPSLFQTKTEVSSSFLPSYYFLSFTKCLLGKLCKFGSNSLSIYWC